MDIEKLAYDHGAYIYGNSGVRFYTLSAFNKFAEAYHQAKCNEEIQTLRAKVASAENDIKDAERYRWLVADHDNKDTRQKCRDLLSRLGVMSYSAASSEIDQAIAQEVK